MINITVYGMIVIVTVDFVNYHIVIFSITPLQRYACNCYGGIYPYVTLAT